MSRYMNRTWRILADHYPSLQPPPLNTGDRVAYAGIFRKWHNRRGTVRQVSGGVAVVKWYPAGIPARMPVADLRRVNE